MYDIIIVGAGPAGLTAALYARRAGKTVLVIEKDTFGGQITFSPKIENYPGFNEMSGNEFADRLIDQVLLQGAEIEPGRVVSVKGGDVKTVITEDGEYKCRAVILATGVRHRMLGISGETELVGRGISFCAVCDGAFYKGKNVAVVGGGNSALQEAILLSETSKKVTVIQNLPELTGEARLADVLTVKDNVEVITNATVSSFISDENGLCGVNISVAGEEKKIDCDGVFIAIGLIPENGAFEDLASLSDKGYFASDERCLTNTPGIFVAGDCREKGVRQITTACADGSTAALAACAFLDR